MDASVSRLRKVTAAGDYTYYVDIATAMGGLPQLANSAVQWLEDPHTVRQR
ncbi:hypothetical protein AADR41_11135 [Streptomyces sp. CLV115]|uniref:hypothetical protein n=1 Tax=Streptomyces sp. CLV115 TaxID=3138502 RepID=UPI00313EB179